jgi:arginine-tRNA-protein transferase
MNAHQQGTLAFHPLSAQLDKYLQQHPTGYHPFDAIENGFDSKKIGVDQAVECDSDDGDGDESEHDEELDFPDPPPPGFGDPSAVQESDLDSFLVMLKGGVRSRSRLVQLGVSSFWHVSNLVDNRWHGQDLQFVNSDGTYRLIKELVAAVGSDHMAAGTSLNSMKDKGILYFG